MLLPARLADSELLQPRRHHQPRRVFIVAEPKTADQLFTLAAYWGHDPYWFADPGEALRVAPQLKPEAVLVEVLAGTTGLKFVSRLRAVGVPAEGLVAVVPGVAASQRRLLNRAGYGHIVEQPSLFVGLRGVLDGTTGWREDGPRAKGFHRLVEWARQLRTAVALPHRASPPAAAPQRSS